MSRYVNSSYGLYIDLHDHYMTVARMQREMNLPEDAAKSEAIASRAHEEARKYENWRPDLED